MNIVRSDKNGGGTRRTENKDFSGCSKLACDGSSLHLPHFIAHPHAPEAKRYLLLFVLHGTPTALRPDDHGRLADFFGVDERALGVRNPWKGAV